MPGTLTHSPATAIQSLLIALGVATDPASSAAWPVYASAEPDTPDNCITVYDTAGRDEGRRMTDGQRNERSGFQVRVRSKDHATGYTKARAIAVAMDGVLRQTVLVSTQHYLIWAVTRSSDVLALGPESPSSKRPIFTVNATASIKQT